MRKPSVARGRPRTQRGVALSTTGVIAAVSLLASCGSPTPSALPPAPSTTSPTRTTTTTTTTPAVSTTPSTTPSTTDPGTLPQTAAQPPTDDASLATALAPLWDGITTGQVAPSLPAFFPESAYLQLKTGILPDPASDYADRLVAFYRLDVAAYHQALVGAGSFSVVADPSMAAWIAPGTCENRFGYWHLPGVRLVTSIGGQTQSVGVASLISWRGTWYVVHLGPNPRPTNVGTVDAPATGPGTPGPAGGC